MNKTLIVEMTTRRETLAADLEQWLKCGWTIYLKKGNELSKYWGYSDENTS